MANILRFLEMCFEIHDWLHPEEKAIDRIKEHESKRVDAERKKYYEELKEKDFGLYRELRLLNGYRMDEV